VLDPDNRRVLRASGVVVWLRASAEVLARRVGTGANRPLLRDDPLGTLRRLERLREPAYEAAAHCILDTDEMDLDDVATQVLASFESVSA
jgi:shikimate kinase